VITGKPFDQLVQERVLGPLKMTDTSYFVSDNKKSRVAAIYAKGPDGSLTRVPDTEVYSFRKEKPVQINGGFGLTSSIDDYMRFALMLQNEGSYDGVQILKPETVAFMAEDHLPPGLTDKDFLPSKGVSFSGMVPQARYFGSIPKMTLQQSFSSKYSLLTAHRRPSFDVPFTTR